MRYGYVQLPRSAVVEARGMKTIYSISEVLKGYFEYDIPAPVQRCNVCHYTTCVCNWTEFPASWCTEYDGKTPAPPSPCNICGETAPLTWSSSEFGPCTFRWCFKCWKTGHPEKAHELRGRR